MQDRHKAPLHAASGGGNPVEPEMNPGDQPPPGTPATGENICPRCNGGGVGDDGMRCEHCGGTGKAVESGVGV